ncbi:MAG: hypothetical protein J2P57_08815 [Acidimicrobiaceae bacterium]|nr:hypothetical protein [Acidimicrobiaceae bacterium]
MTVGDILAILLPVVFGYASGIFATLWYLGHRIDRLEDRLGGVQRELGEIRVDLGRIDQKIDDHINHHPGPTTRLVQ